MRSRSAVLSLVALLGLGGVAHSELSRVPLALFAPAYDTVTQASLHDLALAMQSYAMFEDGLDGVTVAALAEWGWAPGGTTAVTIWVDGEHFRAVAQDVRPGAHAFEYASTSAGTSGGSVEPTVAPDVTVPGVTITPVTGL